MKKRYFALALVLVLLVGIFAGCSKKNGDGNNDGSNNGTPSVVTPTKNDQSQTTSKFAYKATYLTLPSEIDSVSMVTASGNTAWFTGNVKDGQKEETYTYTDENGEEQTETYTYDVYVSKLYTIDLESQTCSEVTAAQLPEVDEGWEGNCNIGGLQVDSDGTLWVYCNLYQYKTELPEDFDPETDQEWNYQTNENKSVLLHLSADGTELGRFELNPPQEEGNDYNSISSVLVANGTVYAYDWQNLYLFDTNGTYLATVDMSSLNGNELCRYDANTVGMTSYVYDEQAETGSMYFVPFDPETRTWNEEDKIAVPSEAWKIYPGSDGYDFIYSYNSKIFGYVAKTDTKEKLLDWMDNDINPNDMNNFSILDDGRILAVLSHWDEETMTNSSELVLMTRVDASTLPEKTVLTLACFYMDYNVQSKVVEFNKNSDEYRIVVKDYSEYRTDDDWSAGLTKLNTEIMSGVIPDMFLTDNLPVDRYAAKGVLADLYTFIDNDSSLTRDSFVPEVLRACETDGKLYQLPSSFIVQTAYGLSKVVDDYDTWNVAAVQDAMTKLPEGAYIFDYYSTRDDVMSTCVSNNLAAFVDWQTGKCSFDSEAFISLLNFVNAFPAEFDWEQYNKDNEFNYTDDATMMKNGQKLLTRAYLYSFDDFLYSMSQMGDTPVSFVGYPSEDGTGNHLFSTSTGFAISSQCAAPDVAWTFLSELVREDWQENNVWNFPINKTAFDKQMEKAMTPDYQYDENGEIMLDENGEPMKYPKTSYSTAVAYDPAFGVAADGSDNGETYIYELSQEQADMILDVISKTTRVATYDQAIMDIVNDEASGFFAGQETAESAAASIQSRVQLYVAEQS